MTISLRPYQQRAKDTLRSRIMAGIRRPLVVAPTGAGKTVLFASIVESAVARGTHVLVCAHRRELVRQPWIKFIRAGLDPAQVGVVLAGVEAGAAKPVLGDADDDMLWHCLARRRPDALVQVASIDSIRNRAKPKADLIIIDEAHRVLSASYLKLAEEYPSATIIGLTATPLRADSKPLGSFFEDMIIVATYRELIASGHLVEPRVFTVPAAELPDLSRVRIKGNDYDPEALDQACNQAGLVGDVVSHWQRHGNDAPTFVFAVSVDHSKNIAARFVAAGITAKHVDANTPAGERDAAFRDLRTGALKVLTNVDVATEGVDVVQVKTVVLARPTKSLRIYAQQIGRGSRPSEGGKPFVVLDHCGSVLEFGLPHMIEWAPEILWSPKSKSAVKSAPAKTCPECFAVVPANATTCDGCQYEFQKKVREAIEERDGDLVEVSAPTEDDLRATWTKLCEECVAQGYNPKWVFVRWGELYPRTKPPDGCKPPDAEAVKQVNADQLADLDRRIRAAIEKGHKPGAWKMGFKSVWHRYPSQGMFEQTEIGQEIRGWLAGLECLMRMQAPVKVEPEIKPQRDVAAPTIEPPVTVANDVELVEWAV